MVQVQCRPQGRIGSEFKGHADIVGGDRIRAAGPRPGEDQVPRAGRTELGIVGGTGPLGRGLALRLAADGWPILLGSRDPDRARSIADQLNSGLPKEGNPVEGVANLRAAAAEVVVVAVPYDAMLATVTPLAAAMNGHLVVGTAVPMQFRGGRPEPVLPTAGSAAQELASACLGAEVVSAFHTVAAGALLDLGTRLDEDVLVCGDHPEARARVAEMIRAIEGLRPVDAGELANSHYPETITPLLLRLNRLHRSHTGIRITGV